MTPTCERLRPAIEALLEGALDDEHALSAEAAAHLEGCEACQAAAEETASLREALADAVPVPPPDVWRVFDDELRERLAATTPERAGRILRLGGFGGALLAAAAVLLLTLGAFAFRVIEPTVTVRSYGRVPVYSLDYGDPAWKPRPDRGRVDPSRVEGLTAVELTLSPAAQDVLTTHGVVQVPAGTERLADLYPLTSPPGAPPPLATADASLLLAGAAASRAALALELDVVAPGLRELLAHAQRELRRLEVGTRDDAARRAVRRARELLGVAAELAGVDPRLPEDSARRVRDEVGYVLAGAPYTSPILGRAIDARALAPRGLFAVEPELRGHARAAAWLSIAALPLDAARPDDVRAAGMIALALANGRGERRTALDLQAHLEAALEVLYGEPDGLTPLDMLEVLRQGLATEALTPSALAAHGAVERLTERAALVVAARGKERVGPPGPPAFRLLGGTRSLEGLALTRLAPPALARPHPTSLDLLVLLGSRRARTVVSAMGLDAPGYDAAAAGLGDVGRAWADASRAVPARTCLEQARLWGAAALVAPDVAGAAPVTPGVYADRLLLAALAALNAPPPSPDAASDLLPATQGPVPLVEPLPRLHARLAFTADRLARVLDDLTTGRVAPRARAAAAGLRRVARLEQALRDASLDAVDGRTSEPETLAALRDYAPAVHALGPARATSAEDVYVERGEDGEVRVLHRVVHALDRLHLVVVDPASGQPVLAAGAALSASERWTSGERRLAIPAGGGDHDPEWAAHVVRE